MKPISVMHGFSRYDILCMSGVVLCCLSGFAPITKYFGGLLLILFAVAISICSVILMIGLRWFQLRSRNDVNPLWLVGSWCIFAILFAVLFPIANNHVLGPGSDRADALQIAASALIHGHYPYRAETYLGGPITPLPGAVILAIPFLLIGNVSLQNLLWLALFLVFCLWYFRTRFAAAVSVLLLLGGSAASLDDFVVGGDFLINSIYVCIAMALVMAAHNGIGARWKQIGAAAFLGIAIDSRPVYLVIAPLLLAYILQRNGRAAMLRLLLISGLFAVALSLPFYLYDPAHFSPLHLSDKLDFLPPSLHADWLLPALGLSASCSGFFVRLTRERMFLLTGISLLVMVGPAGVVGWFLAPFTFWGWFQLCILSLPAFFFSLFFLGRFQQNGVSLRAEIEMVAIAAS